MRFIAKYIGTAGGIGLCVAASLSACTPSAPGLGQSANIQTEGAPSGGSSGSSLAWGDCEALIASDTVMSQISGTPPQLEPFKDRLRCATVSVPLHYDKPDGEQIDIAISALEPVNQSKGYVLTNPGGPGLEGRTMPTSLASIPDNRLADDFTLVGVDVRGTGGSTSFTCPGVETLEEEPAAIASIEEAREVAAASWELNAQANRECAEDNQALAETLTAAVAARDLDLVRTALGADQVGYLGASWGTELGIAYQSLFPQSVAAMVLDSVVDTRHDTTESLNDIVANLEKNEAAVEGAAPLDFEVAQDDAVGEPMSEAEDQELAEGPVEEGPQSLDLSALIMPLNVGARMAYTCNVYEGAADQDRQLRDLESRYAAHGDAALSRPQHPVSGLNPGVTACAGWPFPVQEVPVEKTDVPLLLVGHSQEIVTPVQWTQTAHEKLGGELLILDDADHGGAVRSGQAEKVFDFLSSNLAKS